MDIYNNRFVLKILLQCFTKLCIVTADDRVYYECIGIITTEYHRWFDMLLSQMNNNDVYIECVGYDINTILDKFNKYLPTLQYIVIDNNTVNISL